VGRQQEQAKYSHNETQVTTVKREKERAKTEKGIKTKGMKQETPLVHVHKFQVQRVMPSSRCCSFMARMLLQV